MSAYINDFAKRYAESGTSRLHMPGHKGVTVHGLEKYDLTEIKGADSLYEAQGIILQSEMKTSRLFGSRATCYSAEGSSLSIKAALAMVKMRLGRSIKAAAPRNCHRAFINGCVLLGIEPIWIYPEKSSSLLCECAVTAKDVQRCFETYRPDILYVTSPDYLGNMADIAALSNVCRRYGVIFICDNAHGAYLKFLERSLHPLDFGADIVCDSAHKTLPVYTGGAYLHVSESAPEGLENLAKSAMALFGSTSPSYLIMESLDLAAELLETTLPERIRSCCKRVGEIKLAMAARKIVDISAEPMKITVSARGAGYSGTQLAEMMRACGIECEYSDPNVTVLMFSPYNRDEDFERVESFFGRLELREPIRESAVCEMPKAERAVSLREAALSAARRVSVDEAEGKICARSAMSCQPSVAIVMSGEKITKEIIKILKNYSIFEIDVI